MNARQQLDRLSCERWGCSISELTQVRNERDEFRRQLGQLEGQLAALREQNAEIEDLRERSNNYRQQFDILQRKISSLSENVTRLEHENRQLQEKAAGTALQPEYVTRLNANFKKELSQINLNAMFWRSNAQVQAIELVKKYLEQLPARTTPDTISFVAYEQSSFKNFIAIACSTLWPTKSLEDAKADLNNLCLNTAIQTKNPHLLSLLKQNGARLFRASRDLIAQVQHDPVMVKYFVEDQTQCPVCFSEDALARFPLAFNCGHIICVECKNRYVLQKIQSGQSHICINNCPDAF